MNKKNPNTEEILDAIRNMMAEGSLDDQALPKDVIELTNPINNETKFDNEKIGILELSNPINELKNADKNEELSHQKVDAEVLINDDQIRKAVRNAIELLPTSKLDEIINEELTKIIQKRLNSSKIIISSENNN